jgi:hypothetical protein
MGRGLGLAREIAAVQPAMAGSLFEALAPPFSIRALDQERRISLAFVARSGALWDACRSAVRALEPDVPWRADVLSLRAECYERARDGGAARAAADLRAFQAGEASVSGAARSPR